MHVLPAFRAAGWQPTGFGGCITCMFYLLLGLQVGNLQGLEAAVLACFANFWGCRLATYRVWRLHYLHFLLTLMAAAEQPTGFGGCITCMFCQLFWLQVGNLEGLEATLLGCSTCFWGGRLATYGVWRLHYLHVLPDFRAAGWQPMGFGGCITCMFYLLLGLQVGNLQGLVASVLACSANS